MTCQVNRHHSECLGENFDLLFPIGLITHPTMHEHEVRAIEAMYGEGNFFAVKRK